MSFDFMAFTYLVLLFFNFFLFKGIAIANAIFFFK